MILDLIKKSMNFCFKLIKWLVIICLIISVFQFGKVYVRHHDFGIEGSCGPDSCSAFIQFQQGYKQPSKFDYFFEHYYGRAKYYKEDVWGITWLKL